MSIVAQSSLGEEYATQFGSECLGVDFDGTMRLSRDWFDVDGAGNRTVWIANGAPACTSAGTQEKITMVPDGFGGTILAWEDLRAGNRDIYIQRLDSRGHPLWPIDGVAVVTNTADQVAPRVMSDGAGGAVVAWTDLRPGLGVEDIYAQRVSGLGIPLWTSDGVAICTASQSQRDPALATDGSGGAIVAWSDVRGSEANVYAQRVDGLGTTQWASNGVPVVVTTDPQYGPEMVSDGSGGAIIVWTDYRTGNGPGGHGDLYAQRLSSSGATQWTSNGVAVVTAPGDQGLPRITASGNGGAIIVWQDGRGQAYSEDVYAQRLDASGAALWPTDGVAVCTAANSQRIPDAASDGKDGVFVAWVDFRTSPAGDRNIYAQRIRSDGTAAWTADGIVVCAASGNQAPPRMVADGAGGTIIAWNDPRSLSQDIYAQRLSGGGTARWAANGVAVCSATGVQELPMVASDAAEGAIIAWVDQRNGNKDIFAGRVSSQLGTPITSVAAIPVPGSHLAISHNRPNPFNPRTEISFILPSGGAVRLRVFDVAGRLVRTLVEGSMPLGVHTVAWDGLDGVGRSVASGVYLARLEQGREATARRMVLLR